MKELVSPREAARMLCVTTDCLRKWEQSGKLQCVRTVGNHRRYKIIEIEALLHANDKE